MCRGCSSTAFWRKPTWQAAIQEINEHSDSLGDLDADNNDEIDQEDVCIMFTHLCVSMIG